MRDTYICIFMTGDEVEKDELDVHEFTYSHVHALNVCVTHTCEYI